MKQQATLADLKQSQNGSREAKLETQDTRTGTQLVRAHYAFSRPALIPKVNMKYEDARQVFIQLCKSAAKATGATFVQDSDNEDVIQDIVKYLIGDKSCNLELHKGILLYGASGTGKTMLMKCMKVFANMYDIRLRNFRFIKAFGLYDIATEKGQMIDLQTYYGGHLCIDDLGDEPATFLHFGNPVRVMDRVINERYDNWVSLSSGSVVTHITTNMGATGTPLMTEIEDKYGSRVSTRCKQMLNLVPLTGKSRRV